MKKKMIIGHRPVLRNIEMSQMTLSSLTPLLSEHAFRQSNSSKIRLLSKLQKVLPRLLFFAHLGRCRLVRWLGDNLKRQEIRALLR